MLSAGNLVVHEGNTLLPKDEVEMLTVLRINRGWMEYMRAHHAEEAKAQAKQPFNMTVVDADDAAAGPSERRPERRRPRAGRRRRPLVRRRERRRERRGGGALVGCLLHWPARRAVRARLACAGTGAGTGTGTACTGTFANEPRLRTVCMSVCLCE